jgi:hypothetical protein
LRRPPDRRRIKRSTEILGDRSIDSRLMLSNIREEKIAADARDD